MGYTWCQFNAYRDAAARRHGRELREQLLIATAAASGNAARQLLSGNKG